VFHIEGFGLTTRANLNIAQNVLYYQKIEKNATRRRIFSFIYILPRI